MKVLIITGLHGSEQYSKCVVEQFKLRKQIPNFKDSGFEGLMIYPDLELIFFHREYTKNQRELSLNMNNVDDINTLIRETQQMNILLELMEEADIVLDVHNSTNCDNLALVSIENESYLKKYNDYFGNGRFNPNIPLVWRYSKVQTISELARRKGKLGLTLEIGGMSYDFFSEANQKKIINDAKWLDTIVQDCYNFIKSKNCSPNIKKAVGLTIPEKQVMNHFNRLRTGSFPLQYLPMTRGTYNTSGGIGEYIYIVESLINEYKEDICYQEDKDTYDFGIRIMAYENNYNEEIEFIITRSRKMNMRGPSVTSNLPEIKYRG